MNTARVSSPQWKWFLALAGIIVLANFSAHHLIPLPAHEMKFVTMGSLLDFIIVIPLLAYFFVFKKKRQIAPVIGVALLGSATLSESRSFLMEGLPEWNGLAGC
ncbi:hypothetical protein AC623_15970 [Bacillus sp. FJAT-27231]|uniref:hypothetical protein n=1 Tax=Bacillus sp. FJAT-27231 TaxID=1679168 RepID=UPI0006715085|nr:hypothetical protein [Bacillus sp. FJAT-27231]KMY55240.1 hypothetical protein AC623_15970 [Bacillus sp. FJAT-27231]